MRSLVLLEVCGALPRTTVRSLAPEHDDGPLGMLMVEVDVEGLVRVGLRAALGHDDDLALLSTVKGGRHPEHGLAKNRTWRGVGETTERGDRPLDVLSFGGGVSLLEPLDPLLVGPIVRIGWRPLVGGLVGRLHRSHASAGPRPVDPADL